MSRVVLIDCELPPTLRTDHYDYPLQGTEPLGLGYLAAYLIEAGHTASIVKLPLTDSSRQQIIEADIIGLSFLTYQWPTFITMANLCRRMNPRAKIVAGREHPTAMPELCLNEAPIDFVICGEGEIPILQLADNIEPCNIPSLAYRINGDIRINPKAPRLDKWLKPVRNEKFMTTVLDELKPLGDKTAGIMLSRGCPNDCDFCTNGKMWGKCYRKINVDELIDEIFEIKRKYDIKTFAFHDLMIAPELLDEFCRRIIERNVEANFFAMMSITQKLPDFALARQAGFVELAVGLEIPNDARIAVGKHYSLEVAKYYIEQASSAGVLMKAYTIIGWPHDQDENKIVSAYGEALLQMPIHFLRVHFLVPFPGTRIWQDYGDKLIYPMPSCFEHFTTMEPTLDFGLPPEALINARRRIMENYYCSDHFKKLHSELNPVQKSMLQNFLSHI